MDRSTTVRISSWTLRNGRKRVGPNPSPGFLPAPSYGMAKVDAASTAASESISHLALLTAAAAAKSDDSAGKMVAIPTCSRMVGTVWCDMDKVLRRGSSTTAAVAAAHSPLSADVKGKMAELRLAWFA